MLWLFAANHYVPAPSAVKNKIVLDFNYISNIYKLQIFKKLPYKTADGLHISLIVYILSYAFNLLIIILKSYRTVLQNFFETRYNLRKNRLDNFNNNNVMLKVQFFMDAFTFSDFESPLILFSWWRDKIS